MKNKFQKQLIYAILVVLFCTTNFAYAGNILTPEKQGEIVKLLIVMGVVLFSSIVMAICLSLYNKFIVKADNKGVQFENTSLKTPEDTDQAIMSYIVRNRLK